MTELINFPDGTVQHAYLTTDNANDDLEIAVLDGDLVILDTNENPVLRWDASATQWDFVSQDVVGVGSLATDQATIGELAAVAELTSAQTISNNSTTDVGAGGEMSVIFEDTNIIDLNATNGQFTTQQAGGFLISAYVHWQGSTDWSVGDTAHLNLDIGGSTEAGDETEHSGDNRREKRAVPAAMYDIASSTVVKFTAFQTSAASQTLEGQARRSKFSVWRLRE